MTVSVNGVCHTLPDGQTVAQMLVSLDFNPQRVAVERCGEIVPRAQFDAVQLQDGDQLEVVQFVGGG